VERIHVQIQSSYPVALQFAVVELVKIRFSILVVFRIALGMNHVKILILVLVALRVAADRDLVLHRCFILVILFVADLIHVGIRILQEELLLPVKEMKRV